MGQNDDKPSRSLTIQKSTTLQKKMPKKDDLPKDVVIFTVDYTKSQKVGPKAHRVPGLNEGVASIQTSAIPMPPAHTVPRGHRSLRIY